jgi:hypothetical protein
MKISRTVKLQTLAVTLMMINPISHQELLQFLPVYGSIATLDME